MLAGATELVLLVASESTKRMVCLASSLKRGGLCIAGRELAGTGPGTWTRPVSARPGAELTYLKYRYESGFGPKPLDIVDVPVLKADRRGHQVENVLIDGSRRWTARGRLPFMRVAGLAEEPASLWTNSESTSRGCFNCVSVAEAARFDWSLCLIQVRDLWIESRRPGRGEKVLRACFRYHGIAYKLSVTDPVVRERFDLEPPGVYQIGNREKYLCVSLSEVFEGDGRCHKVVAAIIVEGDLELA